MTRILIPPPTGKKDASGAYLPPEPPKTPEPVGDVDIAHLLKKTLDILHREVKHLTAQSTEKLSPNSSRDLVNYVKLLSDLEDKEAKLIDDMSREDLKALILSQFSKAELAEMIS